MPTQQPSLSHKKWFQTLLLVYIIATLTISILGGFSGPNGYYYMAISVSITFGFIIYSLVKGFSDWKIFLVYGVIAITLLTYNFISLR
jgi:hypothetical protein